MELRPQEDDPKEQRQNADAMSSGLHVLAKRKLRLERLRGQVRLGGRSFYSGNEVSAAKQRNSVERFLAGTFCLRALQM
jgi:hypothetical protein